MSDIFARKGQRQSKGFSFPIRNPECCLKWEGRRETWGQTCSRLEGIFIDPLVQGPKVVQTRAGQTTTVNGNDRVWVKLEAHWPISRTPIEGLLQPSAGWTKHICALFKPTSQVSPFLLRRRYRRPRERARTFYDRKNTTLKILRPEALGLTAHTEWLWMKVDLLESHFLCK